jgi:hypothetical protein
MQTGTHHLAGGIDLADNIFVVDSPGGFQCDSRRIRLFAKPRFERRLYRPKFLCVHGFFPPRGQSKSQLAGLAVAIPGSSANTLPW